MLYGVEEKDLDAPRYEKAISSLCQLSDDYDAVFKEEEPTYLQKIISCFNCCKSKNESKDAIIKKVLEIKSDLYIATCVKATNPGVKTNISWIDAITLDDLIKMCVYNVKNINEILSAKEIKGIDYKDILDSALIQLSYLNLKSKIQLNSKPILQRFSDELKDGIKKLAKKIESDVIHLKKEIAPAIEEVGKGFKHLKTGLRDLVQKKKSD